MLGDQGPGSGAVRAAGAGGPAGAAASGGVSAAVELAAVWASLGPEPGAPRGGWDVRESAQRQLPRPPKGSAVEPGGSVSESQLRAAGTGRPAAARSHQAAAGAAGVFPSALGWNGQPGRPWSCSWGKGPHHQAAAELPVAKASVFHTLCSPGAWSVLVVAALDTEGAEGRAVLVQ